MWYKPPKMTVFVTQFWGTRLPTEKAAEFHTIIAKGLFACKSSRTDIHPNVADLCARVQKPTTEDWKNMVRMLKYINVTHKEILVLSAENLHVIKWYVGASFYFHPDFKLNTGGIMTLGGGAIQYISHKQNLNTLIMTEAELVETVDTSTMILWRRLFVRAQGCDIDKNTL